MSESVNLVHNETSCIKKAVMLIAFVVIVHAGWDIYTGVTKNKVLDDGVVATMYGHTAAKLLSEEQFQGLIDLSSRIINYNDEAHLAYWYRAQAYNGVGNYPAALADIELLLKNKPDWKKQYIDPVVSQIKAEMTNEESEQSQPAE